MPRFNMSWIYIMVIVGLMAIWFTGGDSATGSISKPASYNQFKVMVANGYASKIVVNTDEKKTEDVCETPIYPKGFWSRN